MYSLDLIEQIKVISVDIFKIQYNVTKLKSLTIFIKILVFGHNYATVT